MRLQPDWLPVSRTEQSLMLRNIKDKIGGYQIILNLSGGQIERIKLICDIFLEVNSFVEQSYITARNITDWQNLILTGTPKGAIPPVAPVFQQKDLPKGAFIGILDEFRDLISVIKSSRHYTEKIGGDLLIIGNKNDEMQPSKIYPILKIQTFYGRKVSIEGNLQGMQAMRVEYSNNTYEWQTVAFLTKLPAEIKINLLENNTKSGQIRAILINDNDEIGQFSLNYPIVFS